MGTGTSTATGTTGGTTTTTATLVVHAYFDAGGTEYAEETAPLLITPLGPGGELPSPVETFEHTVHVPPGKYKIEASVVLVRSIFHGSETVTLGEDQTLEVTLKLNESCVYDPPGGQAPVCNFEP